MLEPAMSVLVRKGKAVGLVACTALVTSALVGGGAVVVTTVSSESPAPLTTEQSVPSAEPSAEGAPAVTPEVTPGAVATEQLRAATVEESVAPAQANAPAQAAAAAPTHVCLPGEWRNHGHYVSTYAKSLPKGEGRGPLVSAAAQSDCGKPVTAAGGSEVERRAKPGKPETAARPGKPEKAAKPAKPEKAAKPAEGNGAEDGD